MDGDSSKYQLADCLTHCIIVFSGLSSYSQDAKTVRSNLFLFYLMTCMFGTSGRRLLLISFLQYVQELDLDPF